MQIKTIGIGLGKAAAVARQAGRLAGQSAACLIGMEASCGAHHLARRLSALGHEVRLMPGQYVRPFVKTNKHDLTARTCGGQPSAALRDAGATAAIQPGGSLRDDEVIAAADRAGTTMVFTGIRHFRH